ncbi:MAG: hypothetical protein AAF399_10845 [Bacteroidota bacterium]
MYRWTYVLLLLTTCWACTPPPAATEEVPIGNPAAEGFDEANSDAEAIAIADEVMEAMGGRRAWDTTRYFTWDFFGFRTLTWDKTENRVRIDLPGDTAVYILDMNTDTGLAWEKGIALTDADSLANRMERAKSIWINDSYWLVMPFKLKDSGVTLTYVGKDSTEAGEVADLLELRFKDVGRTPQNKYQVWVNENSRLVSQWAYFPQAEDTEPRFINPWLDYQPYGDLLLSGSRGERGMENISVSQSMAEAVFEIESP